MSEDILNNQDSIEETAIEPTAEQVEFLRNMERAFTDDALPETADEEVVEVAVEEAAVEEVIEAAAPIEYYKELGYDDAEALKADIEAYKALKDQPAKGIEFADEESKKIHELIRQGKKTEVKKWIEAQELLTDVETMNETDKLKLYIKMQNPKFDKEEIEDEYQDLYTVKEDEIFDDIKLRKENKRLAQRIENDVEKAQEYFSQYLKKVQLPDIEPQAITADQDYEDYKASSASIQNFYETVIKPSVNALTEDKVKMSVDVNDANNQMKFGVSITPDKADLEVAKKAALDFNGFISESFYDKEGKFLPDEVAKFVLLKNNFGKYAQSIARQAVNAERVRSVAEEKGGDNVQRDVSTPVEKTEFQKQMEYALS